MIAGIVYDNLLENQKKDQVSISMPNKSQLDLNTKENLVSSMLVIKFTRGPRRNETVRFKASEAPLLIGRNPDCHIQIF